MGQNGSDSISLPVHKVSFGKNYWIDTTEVTCEKFYKVLSVPNQPVPSPRTPITNITWYDAVVYCNALSKSYKLDTFYIFTDVKGSIGSRCQLENVTFNTNANGYRLPTEAEWEYSCRSGRNSLFFWGDDIYKIVEYAWTSSSSVSSIKDVAQLKSNPYGLYDMAGNVWEWCQDWFDKDYYKKSVSIDPMGPPSGTEQVIRGGSVINHYFFAQSGTRSKLLPTQYNAYTGFRTVLVEK
jgi:formylglycine-generating enzyme required for sulfatase activity